MPRPIKVRKVEFFPKSTYFIPLGKQKCKIDEVNLKVEELEAIRLKDIDGLSQEECAQKMAISRQTFQNIIDSARKKIAIALTEGKAININGGNYTTKHCKFKCLDCGNVYEIKYEQDRRSCPECGSSNVACDKGRKFCHRWCKKSE
ncbi:DUF134 domain-containing protein [Clostridium oceanicum]|uniref:UPF0251 protein GCM10008906_05540 n=1 Tax=Clostridium oceanicum TaxID=1543 RepID=A0ABN1JAQ9_9CLOT